MGAAMFSSGRDRCGGVGGSVVDSASGGHWWRWLSAMSSSGVRWRLGWHATPRPSKKAGKTPASSGKLKEQSPKSGSQVSCNSCSKTFNSGKALESHSKAKHGGK
ncbi:hypothetical protein F0562_023982 [Nyssa sinensis]|uniref:C2H2-type domain-containing protein n=1 Tax=Nyssa sinensis TaxID=561372 RepID=A0A5J5BKQ8_9ASTE|nr:hypothetical protein F0562_023982 [Nyssa sinensis]